MIQMAKHALHIIHTPEQLAHDLLPRKNIVTSYVVEDDQG